MLLSDLKGKAQNLFGKVVTRKTKVYDSSKNKLVISGFTIDGITNLELSGDLISKSEVGTSKGYYCYYETWENQTISFDLLPTSQSIDVLKSLITSQVTNKGWVGIDLTDNGKIINKYRAHLIQYPNLVQNMEASDRTFVFGVIPTTSDKQATTVNVVTPEQYVGDVQTFPYSLGDDGITKRSLPIINQ